MQMYYYCFQKIEISVDYIERKLQPQCVVGLQLRKRYPDTRDSKSLEISTVLLASCLILTIIYTSPKSLYIYIYKPNILACQQNHMA